jgi:hypothetical protein
VGSRVGIYLNERIKGKQMALHREKLIWDVRSSDQECQRFSSEHIIFLEANIIKVYCRQYYFSWNAKIRIKRLFRVL